MSDRSVTVHLKAEVAGFIAGMERASLATKDLAKTTEASATAHKESWNKAGTAMLVTGGVLVAGVGMAVGAYEQFDKQMSTVKANIDDKSVPSMQRLADAAMQAGKVTEFSATAAAEAEVQLSKVGVTSAQITGGALVGVLALAAATEIDLPTAATIAAAAMNQFGLSAAQIPHVADLLASAANHALGGVIPLSEALKFVGVAAHQFGISIDSTVGVLAMFASNGITGTMAGTGFRMMLIQMAKPTAEATDLMKQYNITAFDSQGKFVGMATLAGELHTQLGGLTVQQREHTLAVMFGTRALAEANILYAQGSDGVKKWTDTVNQAGFAEMQASTKLNNLAGDWQIFGTSVNVALIKAGASGNDILRNITGFATGAVNAFGELPAPVLQAGLAIGGVAGATLLLGGAATLVTTKLSGIKAAFVGMGVEGATATAMMKGFGIAAAGIAVGLPLLHDASVALTGDIVLGSHTAAAELLSDTGAMGDGFKNLAQTVNLSLGDSFMAGFKRIGVGTEIGTSAVSQAVHWLGSLDVGLSALATDGHAAQAAAMFKKVSDEAARQGISVSQLADALPGYSAAVTAAGKTAGTAAQSVEDLARSDAKAGDALVAMGAKADATGSAMRLIGAGADAASAAVKDLSKAIQTDMDAASKAFMGDMNVLGGYDPSKKGNLSLQDSYKATIAAASKFATDIAAVTAKGLDPNVIAKLLQEGPAKAEPALQAMLSGNSSKMIAMVNTSEKSLAAINARVIESARLTAMAVNSQSDQMSKDFARAMQIDNALAISGGKATVQSLAAQLHIGAGDVARIAAEFGIGIANGVAGGVKPAKSQIDTLQAKIDAIKQNKVPGLKADSKAAQLAIDQLQAQIDYLKQGKVPGLSLNGAPGKATAADLQATITAIKQGKVPGLDANSAAGKAVIADLQKQIDALKQKKPPPLDANKAAADAKVAALQKQIDAIRQGKAIGLDANSAAALLKIAALQAQIAALKGKTINIWANTQYSVGGIDPKTHLPVGLAATGGPIVGPGTETSDEVPILASNGEHMLTADDVNAAGGHDAIFAYRKSLHAYAVGGPIDASAITINMPSGAALTAQRDAAINHAHAALGANGFDFTAPSGGGVSAQGAAAGTAPAAAQAYARTQMSRFGWGPTQMDALIPLWNGESGWMWNASNGGGGPDSGTAYGIPQSLPGSKMASSGADWRTNPATQINWGLNYIKGRADYGSPAAAYSLWQSRSPHWYANGTNNAAPGYATVGENGPEVVGKNGPETRYFRGGETVVPNSQLGARYAPAPVVNVSAPQVHVYVDGKEFKGLVQVELAAQAQAEVVHSRQMAGV
jgi:TP901 family phage tail tape measure protein